MEHKGRYGSLGIVKSLELKGIKVNRKRVTRLMRLMALIPYGTRYRYKNYSKKYSKEECPNLLNPIFKADAKNKIWVADITYIPLCSKKIF